MSKNDKTVEQMVQEAVKEATQGILADVELKVQRAFELGAEIGAATGAEIGAQAAVQAAEVERRRYRRTLYDKRLHNTRLLLRHYRSLNSHYANAVWGEDEEDEDIGDSFADIMALMDSRSVNDTIFVESIRKSSRKTYIIMKHVNTMLREYQFVCERSKRQGDRRRWRVIEGLYLGEPRIEAMEIANREGIDKRTVYKDVDAATADLTMLLFGVDGIEKLLSC